MQTSATYPSLFVFRMYTHCNYSQIKGNKQKPTDFVNARMQVCTQTSSACFVWVTKLRLHKFKLATWVTAAQCTQMFPLLLNCYYYAGLECLKFWSAKLKATLWEYQTYIQCSLFFSKVTEKYTESFVCVVKWGQQNIQLSTHIFTGQVYFNDINSRKVSKSTLT